MSLAGMLLIGSAMYISSVNVYLFKDFYKRPGLLLYVTLATYLPMALTIPFVNRLIKQYGKREVCIVGLIISSVVSLIMFIWKISNPWIFIVFCFFQGLGIGFFTLELWAMAMDVIDYQEMITKTREEAISYSIFTFKRKIGQVLAAFVPILLGLVGYNINLVGQGQSETTILGMYNVATFVPFLLFILMLILMYIYPLNKQNMIQMRETLAIQRKEYDKI